MKKPKNQQEKDKETTKSSPEKLLKEITKAERIISAIGDGISILDRTFTILYENQIHRDLTGDHVGEKCYKAYQKRQGICGGCPVALAFKEGKVHTVQRELQTDQGIKYMEITASPLKDSTGKIIAGIELIRDITERKQAEEALMVSEQHYRNVYNTAPLAFVLWDRETRVTDWNNHAEQMFGWTREEIVGQNFFDYIIPESTRIHVQVIVKLLLEGKLPSYSINENITKSGRIIVCEWNNSIIKDSGGNVMEVISLGLDITERKRAEEALKQSELRYKNIIRTTQDGFWYVDTDGRFLDVNEAACEMLGYERGELLKMKISDIEVIEDEADVIRHIAKMRDAGGDRFETKHKRKDGTIVEVEVTTTFIKDADNERIFVFARDITERKQAEEEIKKRVKELEDFYDMAIGRELRMKELKEQMEEMKEQLGKHENP